MWQPCYYEHLPADMALIAHSILVLAKSYTWQPCPKPGNIVVAAAYHAMAFSFYGHAEHIA